MLLPDGAGPPRAARGVARLNDAPPPRADEAIARVTRHDLDEAGRLGLLPAQAVPALWAHLRRRGGAAPGNAGTSGTSGTKPPGSRHEVPRFGLTHLLYYFGGLLAIGAATLFITEGFQRLGPPGLLLISLVYAAACIWAARRLDARGLEIPAGILATLAICLVPLAAWALQHVLGQWPVGGTGGEGGYRQYHTHIDWRWFTLELATLAAAAVALWALRYPFLMMPVAITLWYMSMDLARLIVLPSSGSGGAGSAAVAAQWDFYRDFSMWFGLAMVLLGFWIDARCRSRGASGRDYAFWLYLVGMLTFWGALSAQSSPRELDKLLYALLNVGFVFVGVLLQRRVFTVCGAFGVAGYLGDLSHRLFKDSLLFPLALTLIGLAVIALGIVWQRHEERVHAWLRAKLPEPLRRWLPVPGA